MTPKALAGMAVAFPHSVKQLIGGLPEGVVLYRYSPLGAGRSSYLLIDVQSRTAAAVDPLGATTGSSGDTACASDPLVIRTTNCSSVDIPRS